MGFRFSSLHKHDLISVVEYSSFTLVTTLQFSTIMSRDITLLARSFEGHNCPTFWVTRDITWFLCCAC